MSTTVKEMMARMDRIEGVMQSIEKAAKTPASGVTGGSPSALFGGGFDQPPPNGKWPEKTLDQLSKAYNNEQAIQMLLKSGRGGRGRGIGWGPALAEMAKNCRNPSMEAVGKIEEHFGFTTVDKAASVGVKGLNGEVRKVALAEGSGITGGYIVPPQFLNQLMTIAAEDSFVEPRCNVIPMTSRTMQIPMLDITTVQASGVSPYFGGIQASWQPEAATINETEPTFKQSEWTAWDLVLYTVSSNQLLQDNGIGLDALLTQLFASAMTWYKEYAFLRGSGTANTMPLGIINAPASYVQSRASGGTFLLADAAAMMSRLHLRSWDDACWIMHISVLPKLIQMYSASSSSDRLVWMSPIGDGKTGAASMKLPQAFLNGLPIYFTEKVPQLGTKGDVMLVDWSRYVVGNRLDVQIDVSNQYLFRTNQLAWRVVFRCDGKPWLNSYITDASGFVSSPFVILNT